MRPQNGQKPLDGGGRQQAEQPVGLGVDLCVAHISGGVNENDMGFTHQKYPVLEPRVWQPCHIPASVMPDLTAPGPSRQYNPDSRVPFLSVSAFATVLIFLAAILPGCSRSEHAAALPAAAYIGTRTTHAVHKAGCGFIGRAKPENLVPFKHLADALAEGYNPCRRCLPAAMTGPSEATGKSPVAETQGSAGR